MYTEDITEDNAAHIRIKPRGEDRFPGGEIISFLQNTCSEFTLSLDSHRFNNKNC